MLELYNLKGVNSISRLSNPWSRAVASKVLCTLQLDHFVLSFRGFGATATCVDEVRTLTPRGITLFYYKLDLANVAIFLVTKL